MTSTRLILFDPVWIVVDDALGETSWELRSEPRIHLAVGMGLVEELRAVRRSVSNYELGRILGMDMEDYYSSGSFYFRQLTGGAK